MAMNELFQKYRMAPHEENGSYAECNYPFDGAGRAPSGACYYFVESGASTCFHRIDCDEYWSFNAGSSLEVWAIDPDGRLEVRTLGIESDADPLLYFPQGTVFASRAIEPAGEGTFFTCITVPRFDYNGFELVGRDEVEQVCPAARAFWETSC